jgi:hypothetical protein
MKNIEGDLCGVFPSHKIDIFMDLDTFQDLLRRCENMIRTRESEAGHRGLKPKNTRYHAFLFNEIIEMCKTH